jgi:hypothetical protein
MTGFPSVKSGLFYFVQSKLPADVRQIRSIGFPSATNHMARSTIPVPEEKSFSSGGIARRFGVVSGSVQQVHPVRQLVKLLLGKRERGHSSGRPVPDDVVNLRFGPAPERAVARQGRRPVTALCSVAMASGAKLCEPHFAGMRVGYRRILKCRRKACPTEEQG